MKRQHEVSAALGLGQVDVTGKGWKQITSTEAACPETGLLRIYWRIRSHVAPRVAGAIPRVRVSWSVFLRNSGQLSDFQIEADAYYGLIVVNGTSAGITTGYTKDGTIGSGYTIEATIFDGGGVAGGGQYAAYTRPVALAASPGGEETVDVPEQVVGMRWFDETGSEVEFSGRDPDDTRIQVAQLAAKTATGTYNPPRFAVAPEVAGGTMKINNRSLSAVENGRLVFYYFGENGS